MAKNILHMMTPLAHMSPFDVNMAIDAARRLPGDNQGLFTKRVSRKS